MCQLHEAWWFSLGPGHGKADSLLLSVLGTGLMSSKIRTCEIAPAPLGACAVGIQAGWMQDGGGKGSRTVRIFGLEHAFQTSEPKSVF